LQIGLFTTLFFQFAAHIGAECYQIQEPSHSWEWVQFSLAHAVRASDVVDTLEAFGWKIQRIRHINPFVGVFLLAYHVVIDLFVLGLIGSILRRIRKRLLANPERAELIRFLGLVLFLLSFGFWMLCALLVRPWRAIDIPLWFVENFVRVIDFPDVMEGFQVHWHQVPRQSLESTLTLLCRFWIAIGLSLVLSRRWSWLRSRPILW